MVRRTILLLAMVAAAPAGLAGAASAAQSPIGNRQHFVGIVNKEAVLYVACPGPATPRRTGHPTGGQSFVVYQTAAGKGYTGTTGGGIFARLTTNPSSEGVLFTTYGTSKTIPTSWTVPCSGTGKMIFQPIAIVGSDGRVSGSARPDIVTVTFQNVAV